MTERRVILAKLMIYRDARKQLHADVLAALAAGATQAEVASASGLSRQHVGRIVAYYRAT